MRIAETIDAFYDEGASMASAGRKYKEATAGIDAHARTQLVFLFCINVFKFQRITIHEQPSWNHWEN